jgi:ATP-dependent protease ClpP protease subunit
MKHWKFRNEGEDSGNETKIISIEKSSNDNSPLGNKLYFYCDIDKNTTLSLIRQIDEMSKQLKVVQYTFSLPSPPHIELHICSDGGEVFPAVAAVERIINSDIPIHTYCEGIVASAATLISCAGHKRFITKSSCMLIHQVSGGMWGNYAEFKDEIHNLELVMNLIKRVYIKKTSLTSEKLDEMLIHDLYMNASECIKHGLVDVIV